MIQTLLQGAQRLISRDHRREEAVRECRTDPGARQRRNAALATVEGAGSGRHAPADFALAGFAELFQRLAVTTFEPAGTIQRLRVVEAVALATAAEDFAADQKARRWLDEDEFLVRRRIHRDVQAAMGGAGMG